MKRVIVSADTEIGNCLSEYLSQNKWKLCLCDFSGLLTKAELFRPDILIIQLPFPACSLRAALLRLCQLKLHPYIILFDPGITLRWASSDLFEKKHSDSVKDVAFLLRSLFHVLPLCGFPYETIQEYTYDYRIFNMQEKIARAEFLRDVIGGISDSVFQKNIRRFHLNLKPRGHYLLVLKGLDPAFFNDYRNNRCIYHLLEDQQRGQVYDVLNKYSGGEIVYAASKHTECLLFNDFPQRSLLERQQQMEEFLDELYTVTDDGQTGHYLSGYIASPDQINDAYADCMILRQYQLFFPNMKYLRIHDFKEHFHAKPASPSVLSSAQKMVQGFDLSGDIEELTSQLEKLFLELKSSIDLNAFHYSCSFLDLFYENFCRRYGLYYDTFRLPVTDGWALSIDDILEIYVRRFQAAYEDALSQNQYKDRAISRIISYVKTHYNKHLTLTDIAEYAGMNPSYVSRKFRQCTDMTLTDYIRKLRMENAKELFHSSQLTVKEAAAAVGYTDARLFSKEFKKYTGVTPTGYMKFSIDKI